MKRVKSKNLSLYFVIGLFFLLVLILVLIGKFKEGLNLDINGNPIDCGKFKKRDVCNDRPGSGCEWVGSNNNGNCNYTGKGTLKNPIDEEKAAKYCSGFKTSNQCGNHAQSPQNCVWNNNKCNYVRK